MTSAVLQTENQRLSTGGLIWAYLRPEFLQFFRALSEISLLLPLAIRFMPWAVLWPSTAIILWLLLMMLIPVYLDRVFALAGTRTNARRTAVVGDWGRIYDHQPQGASIRPTVPAQPHLA